MANIVQMKDSANAVFYPQTHEKAVIDSNGVNLQTKLQSITTPTYVTAWDGASTPVVANIPAGVTVTYNTTSYTGTLAASASTANKTYLVSTGTTDNYNRYVTQLNGSTYSWQNLGSTEIDLSDYATKAELGELDQKVDKFGRSTIDVARLWVITDNRAIQSDGSITSNNSYKIFTIKNEELRYNHITGIASNSLNNPVVAFYSGTPAAATLISTIASTTADTNQNFDVDIPNNAEYIILCRANSASLPSGTLTDNFDLVEQVRELQRDLPVETNDLVSKYWHTLVEGKYINTSGVETSNAITSYITVPVNGQKNIYVQFKDPAWHNLNNMIIFLNGSTYLGKNAGSTDGIAATDYPNSTFNWDWAANAIPDGTTKICINLVRGHEHAAIFMLEPPALVIDKEVVPSPAVTNENIFNGLNGKHFCNASGAIKYNANISSTLPIRCIPGDIYHVEGFSTESLGPSSFSTHYVFFDKKMAFISKGASATISYDVVVPDTAFYVVFNFIRAAKDTFKITKVGSAASPWAGKIWVGLGASMVQQSSSYPGLSWSPMVERATGLVFKNCGIGSTCLAGDGANAFWKRVQAVIDYDPDVVTILGGYNDLYNDIPIGTSAEFEKAVASKDCMNFLGAYSYIIETILAAKKTTRIVLMTPSYAHTNGADHTPGIGLTYKDYADATIAVAEYYCLPVIDLYRNMGINKVTQDTTYTQGDNIHWNARASQIAASLVISKLKEINNAF